MALFGSGKRITALGRDKAAMPAAMPGVISGFGGGTFNMDGTQATPAARESQTNSVGDKALRGYAIREAAPPISEPQRVNGAPSAAAMQSRPLGGSMRQGFDYDAAMRALAGEQKRPGILPYALAAIGDALANHYGNGGGSAVAMLNQMQLDQRARADAAKAQIARWQYQDFARQNEADLGASVPFTIGRDRVQFNPSTGQSEVLYDGPEDFELYAAELGLEPGSDAYFRAVEDYVLRSSGPSAHARDKELDDYRTGNDVRMENLRFGNRQRMEGLRQGNRLETIRSRPAPLGRGGGRDAAGQGGGSLPVVSSPAEAARLPKGTRFRTPDGRVKVVP